eukprot:GHVQ01010032.1.p2 GENE.GHVQ01010032.1~~GHVQ01010032.1.p2  ORF type:complete len:102 (-),score=19.91 GHVQ01010032.1:487-792(-)
MENNVIKQIQLNHKFDYLCAVHKQTYDHSIPPHPQSQIHVQTHTHTHTQGQSQSHHTHHIRHHTDYIAGTYNNSHMLEYRYIYEHTATNPHTQTQTQTDTN